MKAYAVKCDDCKTDMRETDSMRESAEGGLCDSCRTEATSAAERWENHQKTAPVCKHCGEQCWKAYGSVKGQRVRTIYGETGIVISVWGEIMRTVLLDSGRYVQCHHTKIHPV